MKTYRFVDNAIARCQIQKMRCDMSRFYRIEIDGGRS
jgi:hypothetical protein